MFQSDGLIPDYVTTQTQVDDLEAANIVDASNWLATTREIDLFSSVFLRALHKKMLGNVWRWAGEYRKSNTNIGVPRNQVSMRLEEFLRGASIQLTDNTYAPDEFAMRYSHKLVFIHPFENGNGRHARMATNLLLTRVLDRPAFTWGASSGLPMDVLKKRHVEALRAADAGNFDALRAFVCS